MKLLISSLAVKLQLYFKLQENMKLQGHRKPDTKSERLKIYDFWSENDELHLTVDRLPTKLLSLLLQMFQI